MGKILRTSDGSMFSSNMVLYRVGFRKVGMREVGILSFGKLNIVLELDMIAHACNPGM